MKPKNPIKHDNKTTHGSNQLNSKDKGSPSDTTSSGGKGSISGDKGSQSGGKDPPSDIKGTPSGGKDSPSDTKGSPSDTKGSPSGDRVANTTGVEGSHSEAGGSHSNQSELTMDHSNQSIYFNTSTDDLANETNYATTSEVFDSFTVTSTNNPAMLTHPTVPPEIMLPYQKISQRLGKDTLLECIITANPMTTIFWEKDGQRIKDDEKYSIHIWDIGGYTKTMGAFVTHLVLDDYGMYKCVAENDLGRAEDTMSLYGKCS